MRRFIASFGIGCLALGLAFTATAQVPLGTAFTYQGVLKEAGLPAGSTYDLRFQLFDAAAAGAIVASDCVDGVTPDDGLFTVELDFGAVAFDGNARWIEVGVRVDSTAANCGGGAAYQVLTTRQPLTAVPYAMYALGGPGGGASLWQAVGSSITNTNTGFVGIRRSAALTGAEYFGIQAPVNSGYGGMYIRTDGTAGLPFYGYRAGPSGETGWTYLDGASGDWRVNLDGDRLAITDTGEVGIGTISPAAKLEVVHNAATPGLLVTNTGTGRAAALVSNNPASNSSTLRVDTNSTNTGVAAIAGVNSGGGLAGFFQTGTEQLEVRGDSLNARNPGFLDLFKINDDSNISVWLCGGGGNVGIGSASLPVTKLQIDGGTDAALATISSGYLAIGTTNAPNLVFDNNEIMARNNSAASTLFLNHEGGDVHIGQGAGTSTLFVPTVAITGADVAERFPSSDPTDATVAGTVMEIDPQNAGKLRVARGTYNRRVAGVVSGAGNLPVGAILGNLPGHEEAPAIALSGRVWVRCDARQAAIEIGDLLTTAELDGHAMKAADASRSHGAVIGKAMTALKEGETGLVLVLVNLQ